MATQQEAYGQIANYNISPGTRGDGQSSALEVDNKGNLFINTASNISLSMGGRYNASAPVLTDGQRGEIQLDINANLKVTLATLISGEDQTNNLLRVGGTSAAGSAMVGNPVLIGLSDGTDTRYTYTAKAALNNYSNTDGSNLLAMAIFAGNKDTGWKRIEIIDFDTDAISPSSFPSLSVSNMEYLFTGGGWDRARTPHVFKNFSAQLITNETTIWTPTTGKKFRLMGFVITQTVVTGDITVRDNTAGSTILTIPATPTGQPLAFPMGNGILSAAANNVLTFQGASTEKVSGFVYGTEE